MSTEIKRLKLNGTEFAPITLAEAVVVNTNNIPGYLSLTITTLDKVLRALGLTLVDVNDALSKTQSKLTPGSGIEISDDGVISATYSYTLYKLIDAETWSTMSSNPSADYMNTIYLVPSSSTSGNEFAEYVCWSKVDDSSGKEVTTYHWEKLGEVQAETDLSNYVTKNEFGVFTEEAITAVNVTTSTGNLVIVTYNIPTTLYDSMVGAEATETVPDKIETTTSSTSE